LYSIPEVKEVWDRYRLDKSQAMNLILFYQWKYLNTKDNPYGAYEGEERVRRLIADLLEVAPSNTKANKALDRYFKTKYKENPLQKQRQNLKVGIAKLEHMVNNFEEDSKIEDGLALSKLLLELGKNYNELNRIQDKIDAEYHAQTTKEGKEIIDFNEFLE